MKPARSPKYLAWIRTLPCLVCGRAIGVEAAHTGPHGIGQKSADTSAIPLCVQHHRTGRDSYHRLGRRIFEQRYQLDIRAVVARLNSKPSIRIKSNAFVGRYQGEDYFLGNAEGRRSRRSGAHRDPRHGAAGICRQFFIPWVNQ